MTSSRTIDIWAEPHQTSAFHCWAQESFLSQMKPSYHHYSPSQLQLLKFNVNIRCIRGHCENDAIDDDSGSTSTNNDSGASSSEKYSSLIFREVGWQEKILPPALDENTDGEATRTMHWLQLFYHQTVHPLPYCMILLQSSVIFHAYRWRCCFNTRWIKTSPSRTYFID